MADKLRGSGGLDLLLALVLRRYFTSMIYELTGNAIRAELKLVEYLASKGVGLRVAGNATVTCGEFHHSGVIGRFVVDGLSRSACRRDHLLGQPALGIVIIPDGIDDNLRDYDLSIEDDVAFCRTNDSAFLMLIIILLFARNVNRTDDVTVAIVNIEKLRTSK